MVYESMHKRRLQTLGVRIVTSYYDDGVTARRSSDGTLCDDVTNGVILDKTYEYGGKTVLRETEFNPGILYSFVFPETADGTLQCPNCGGEGDRDAFSEGCPYCGAAGNLEYAERKEGERAHADCVVPHKGRSFLWLLLLIAVGVGICTPLGALFSRTAFWMDYLKGAGVGLLLGLAAFFVRQFALSRTDIRPQERMKQQRQSSTLETFRQDLARADLSLTAFHNGLSAELNRYFYGSEDPSRAAVADYDILDFSDQKIGNTEQGRLLSANVQLRIVTAHGAHLASETGVWRVTLRHEDKAPTVRLKGGLNMLSCPHCGATLNVEQPTCAYCGAPIAFRRPLTLVSLQRAEDPNPNG